MIKKITLIIILWRVALTLLAAAAVAYLPYMPTFPYAKELLAKYGNRIITTWAQFDGVHYLTIIEKGYEETGLIQAFFPLYPLLVKFLSFNIFNPVLVGIAVSTISLWVGLIILRKLILMDADEGIYKRMLFMMILAPTSFFLTSLYTESLFFLLTVSCFFLARKGHWWAAGLVGALAASTRLIGIFLIPALIFEYWEQRKGVVKFDLSKTFIPGIGLAAFMAYLQQTFKDPLLFFHAQASFGTARETSRFILLYQVFYRYLKMFATVPPLSHTFYIVTQEFTAGLAGLGLAVSGWFNIRRSYIVFMLLAYLTPTLTGTFASLPRYLLPLFPIYMVLAKILPRPLYALFMAVSTAMLVINLILFTQGLWVA